MNILLSGEFEAGELHVWQECLHAALPDVRWLDREQALAAADTVQVAVVANPPPGSLRGLPKLRLIQSLWAGVDRLLLDPTLPPGVPKCSPIPRPLRPRTPIECASSTMSRAL